MRNIAHFTTKAIYSALILLWLGTVGVLADSGALSPGKCAPGTGRFAADLGPYCLDRSELRYWYLPEVEGGKTGPLVIQRAPAEIKLPEGYTFDNIVHFELLHRDTAVLVLDDGHLVVSDGTVARIVDGPSVGNIRRARNWEIYYVIAGSDREGPNSALRRLRADQSVETLAALPGVTYERIQWAEESVAVRVTDVSRPSVKLHVFSLEGQRLENPF